MTDKSNSQDSFYNLEKAPDVVSSTKGKRKKRSKSVDLDGSVILLNVVPLQDDSKRRLSQGDIPLWLIKKVFFKTGSCFGYPFKVLIWYIIYFIV